MTVRYKSATLDEFIEHHSHDVSRGGMFIKTQQPFPPGTLLKFEVRLAEDQKVMQGVGRVVWKRDRPSASGEEPAGMGIKYIKLDDESRRLIDQLLSTRAAEPSAFDAPGADSVEGEAPVGLGLSTAPSATDGKETAATSFFPKDVAVLPPPEDRTVMKQAAELLEEALREVGAESKESGSEKGRARESEGPPPSLAPAAGDEMEVTKPGSPAARRDDGSFARLPASKTSAAEKAGASPAGAEAVKHGPSNKPPASTTRPSDSKLKSSDGGKGERTERETALATQPATPKPLREERRASGASATKPTAAVPAEPPKASPQSSGRGLFWLLAVAASVGVVYWLTRPASVPPPAPEPGALATAVPAEKSVEAPAAAQPTAEPTTASADASVVPSASASAAVAVASASAVPSVSATPPPVAAAPAAPAAEARVATKKTESNTKATETAPSSAGSKETAEPVATPAPAAAAAVAETKPAETKPAETKPEATAAPATVAPKTAAPKKAKAAADSDNPY